MPVPTGLFFISKNTQNGERKMKDNEYVIADNVRFYRKKANLTQAQLAERAELSLDSIKRVEAGKRTMSLENFLRLSDALGIPIIRAERISLTHAAGNGGWHGSSCGGTYQLQIADLFTLKTPHFRL